MSNEAFCKHGVYLGDANPLHPCHECAMKGLVGILDELHNGTPVPWEDLSDNQARILDDELARRAGEYVDADDAVRATIFLNERKRYTERLRNILGEEAL